MAPIGVLLKTVFESILEVLLQCVAGYVLAKRGILDKKTQKQLNRLNVSLFTPALLFSKVAFSLTPEKLSELWIIPIVFALVTVVSMVVAYVLGLIFRLKKSQRNFAMAAAMFMNSNSLPIALMQSLVVAVPHLRWDDDDSNSAMLGRALSYLVLSSTLGMVLRWSYGVHLLSQADPEGSDVECYIQDNIQDETRHRDNPEIQPLLIDIEDEAHATATSHDQQPSITFHHVDDDGAQIRKRGSEEVRFSEHVQVHHDHTPIPPSVFYSFPNTPTRSTVNLVASSTNTSSSTLAPAFEANIRLPDDSESDSDSEGPLQLPSTHHERSVTAPPRQSRVLKALRHARHRLRKFLRGLNEFMTVPLWAALLSFVVVIIPPLQHYLDYHMRPVKGALNAAGNCSIPITLVVLGAYFYKPQEEKKQGEEAGGNGEAQTERNGTAQRGANRRSDRSSFVGGVRSAMRRLGRLDYWKAKIGKKDAKPNLFPKETRTVWIAIIARMVITPLLLLPLMAIGASYDNPKLFDDPVFVVSNVLLISSPPALTLAQITQAASGDAFERLISRTIFWSYCVVTPPATIIYVVLGLLLAKL